MIHRHLGPLAAIVCLAIVAGACTSGSSDADTSTTVTSVPAGGSTGPNLVVLGDSVAAGEGIAYRYQFDYDADSPNDSRWTGGSSDPKWQGRYQNCHQDEQAYGEVTATALGSTLAKFACTGATYLNGLTVAQTYQGTTYRPAQFGDWATKTNLNAEYDEAEPDVVVLTFGADDISFTSIIEYCISGYSTSDSIEVDALVAVDDVESAISEAFGRRITDISDSFTKGDRKLSEETRGDYCTADNPGAPIQKLFWDRIDSGEIARHYKEMVTAIQERGKDPDYGNGKVPEIVFTTYHRPLPAGFDGDCWDVYPLSPAEQSYLDSLQQKLQETLVEAVGDLDGVTIADISKVMDGHRWCSEDPWVYGLSIIWTDLAIDSQAPFHPTPEGQKAIAAVVKESVRSAIKGN